MQYGHGQQGNNPAGNPPARQSLHQNSGPQPFLPRANNPANPHTNAQVNSQTQHGASPQRQHPNPQTHQNYRNQPAFQDLNPGSNPSDYIANISDRVGGSGALKRLIITAILFFTLFLIIATVVFINDRKRSLSEEIGIFEVSLANNAASISQKLDSVFVWMDSAINLRGGAQDIVNFAASSPIIEGAALIDGNGNILAQTDNRGEALAKIDRRNFPANGHKIDSVRNGDGEVRPALIRRVGNHFLAAALYENSLIGTTSDKRSLPLVSGHIIDAPTTIAPHGLQHFYEITANKRAAMMQNPLKKNPTISSHIQSDEKVWIGSVPVPNTNMFLIDVAPRGVRSNLTQNFFLLGLFGLLFLGSAWLIWMLVNQLLRQIDTVKNQNATDKVSKQRYRAAIESSNGGIWEVDLTKNTAFISPTLSRAIGLKEEETTISLSQFMALFETRQRDLFYSHIKRAHLNGPFQIEIGASTMPVYFSCRGRPITREDQSRVVVGMAMDVTENRGAQARLQAAEARLFDALRSMNDSFVIWDQLDRLVLWNSKFEDFFGFAPGTLQQGMSYDQIELESDRNIEQILILSDGTGSEIQLRDGRWIRHLETYTADGGRVSIGTEVTAIRTREQQLHENQDALEKTITVLRKSQVRIVELAENYEQEKIRAEEASQSKSEFLANMSHELRTPLNAINGFSDIMKKEMFGPLGDARYKEYVNDILFSGQHLLSLINDILDMSKIEAGKMTLNTEHLDMSEMISQVMRIVRGRAEENRLKLIYETVETPEIEADPRAVKQILLNLITNAIKFTPEEGVVSIAVEPKQTGLIIHVADTGIGISQADIDRLAKPFEQIDSQHSRQHEGTGLGLALSKSLVELHGGNFNISSVLGEGTTVTFTLPMTVIKKKAAAPDNEVKNEISRLAQDIADVLDDASHNQISAAAPQQQAVSQPPTKPQPLPMAPPHQNTAA